MYNRYTISREYWFSAAHRIEGHPKCGRLHGHNYKVVVEINSGTLDVQGMVLDYGLLDQAVKPLIDQMDHRYLVSQSNTRHGDPYAVIASERGDAFILGVPNSTAETLAHLIHGWVRNAFMLQVENVRVIVHETPKSVAVYEGV